MTLTANMFAKELPKAPLVLFLLVLFTPGLLAQERFQGTVKLEGKTYTASALQNKRNKITKKRSAFQKIKKEERTEADEKQLLAYDKLLGQLDALEKMMAALKNGHDDEITTLDTNKKTSKEDAKRARDELKKIKIGEKPSDDLIQKLVGDVGKAGQDQNNAKAALQQASEDEAKRAKIFATINSDIDNLNKKRKDLNDAIAKEGILPEEKVRLETDLFANECQLRSFELQRDYHGSFVALNKARKEYARIWLEAANARKQVSEAKVEKARQELLVVREKEKQVAQEKADAKRRQAELERSKTRKAVLGLEALEGDQLALQKAEKARKDDIELRTTRLKTATAKIKTITNEIKLMLPEDEGLDAFKENYLRRQLHAVEEALEINTEIRSANAVFLTKIKRDTASTRFNISALQQEIMAQPTMGSATRHDEHTPTDDNNPELAEWIKLNRAWQRNRNNVRGFDKTNAKDPKVAEEMAREFARLPDLEKRWDAARAAIGRILEDRLSLVDLTLKAAKDCLAENDKPVAQLEETQSTLLRLAFWLKEDPPWGELRRKKMREELANLKDNFGKIARDSGEDFVSRIRDVNGVTALILFAAAFLLFGFRRTHGHATEGARTAFQRTDDPLYRLLSMTAWLVAEVGHYLLGIIGIMLLWYSLTPSDPLASTLMTVIGLAALRLSLLRILLYAEVSDQEASKLLFIDARRLIKIAMVGLFVLVPPIAFFDNAGATALNQAARLVAATWIFIVTLRMAFRRDVLLLLLPSKDIGALSRGLKLLIHYFWPLLTVFIAGIIYLKSVGYRTASEILAERSFLAAGVLLAALVFYQFVQAYIDSKTISVTSGKDNREKGHAESKAEKKHRSIVRRVYSIPLLLVSIAATIAAMSWAVGISSSQWSEWGTQTLVDGKDSVDLGDMATSILILIIGYVISGTIRDILVIGGFSKTPEDRRGTRYAMGTLTFYIIMSVTIIFSLKKMSIDLANYGWLLGTAGVALGFGMTEILSNFVCGLILFVERPVQVGDIITVGDVEGDVRKISIRSTIVQTRDGVAIILPNRRLIETDVVNWSHSDPLTRLRINVGVAYGSDVAMVKKALLEVAEREGRILKRPQPEVSFKEFGESELSFQLLSWMPTPDITAHRRVRSDVNSAIDAAFRRFGIEIPFPQRDLHLKTTPETVAKAKEEEAKREEEHEAAAKKLKKEKGSSLP